MNLIEEIKKQMKIVKKEIELAQARVDKTHAMAKRQKELANERV